MRFMTRPSQDAMVNLAGDGWWRWDPRGRDLVLPDHQRVALITQGRDRLREITGQDFGYDLAAWRDYLMTAEDDFGYLDMRTSAFEIVDSFIQQAIGDGERQRLIKWRERYGAIYFGKLRSAPIFRYDDVFCHAIPSASGVYHIFQADAQRSLYVGQSPNMRSHVLGNQVRAIVKRKVTAWQQAEGRPARLGDLFNVQAISVRERDRLMFAQYAADHLQPQIEYRAD